MLVWWLTDTWGKFIRESLVLSFPSSTCRSPTSILICILSIFGVSSHTILSKVRCFAVVVALTPHPFGFSCESGLFYNFSNFKLCDGLLAEQKQFYAYDDFLKIVKKFGSYWVDSIVIFLINLIINNNLNLYFFW